MERMATRLLNWLKRSEEEMSQGNMSQNQNTRSESQSRLPLTSVFPPASPRILSSFSSPGPLTFVVIVPDWDNGSAGCQYLNLLIKETRTSGHLSAVIHAKAFEHQYTSYQTCVTSMKEIPRNNGNEQIPKMTCTEAFICSSTNHVCHGCSKDHASVNRYKKSTVNQDQCDVINRGTSFDSVSPSLMVILQNAKGKEKWPVTSDLIERLLRGWKNED